MKGTVGSETSQYHEEEKRRGSILISEFGASNIEMMDRLIFPK